MNRKIRIKTFPRLHLSLIGMNDMGYRVNGGLGFSIDALNLTITIIASTSFTCIDKRLTPLKNVEIKRIETMLEIIIIEYNFTKNINVIIEGSIPTHSGFGSSTSIKLACIEGLFLVNNKKYLPETIVSLSGRGQTSGIGIRTYFQGGFVFDIGHEINNNQNHLPSSQKELNSEMSLLLKECKMPEWEIGICIPNFISFKTEAEEVEFFKNTCPISDESVYETLYHSVYGVLGSVLGGNKQIFESSINSLQQCKWKKSERELYGTHLENLEKDLFNCGATSVGMSSLGPTLYFTSNDMDNTILLLKDKYYKKIDIFKSLTNNKGRIIDV